MNIKDLRELTNLSQKEFGERIGVKYQTILLYEKGKNVPETVQKLIRYEFAKFLPEEERLYPEGAAIKPQVSEEEQAAYSSLEKENEGLKEKLKNAQQVADLMARNIELLEDQVRLYKQQLDLKDNRSQSA